MIFMDNLCYICWKFEEKKIYFPLQNTYFLNVLTLVKIVPIYNT